MMKDKISKIKRAVFLPRHLCDNRGFTLIEALMALLVLSVGILGIATLQNSVINGNSRANSLSIASTVTNDVYERLLALDAGVNPLPGPLDPAANPHTEAELGIAALPARVIGVEWDVVQWNGSDAIDDDGDGVAAGDNDEDGLLHITIYTAYRDGNGVNRIHTVAFLKGEVL